MMQFEMIYSEVVHLGEPERLLTSGIVVLKLK